MKNSGEIIDLSILKVQIAKFYHTVWASNKCPESFKSYAPLSDVEFCWVIECFQSGLNSFHADLIEKKIPVQDYNHHIQIYLVMCINQQIELYKNLYKSERLYSSTMSSGRLCWVDLLRQLLSSTNEALKAFSHADGEIKVREDLMGHHLYKDDGHFFGQATSIYKYIENANDELKEVLEKKILLRKKII